MDYSKVGTRFDVSKLPESLKSQIKYNEKRKGLSRKKQYIVDTIEALQECTLNEIIYEIYMNFKWEIKRDNLTNTINILKQKGYISKTEDGTYTITKKVK